MKTTFFTLIFYNFIVFHNDFNVEILIKYLLSITISLISISISFNENVTEKILSRFRYFIWSPLESKKNTSYKKSIYILNWGQYKAFLNPMLNTSPSEARLSILTEGSERLPLTSVKMMFTVISWNHHPKPPKCLHQILCKLIIILEYILPDSYTASGMVYWPFFTE